MITAKDIADMVERVDAKLLPLCDYEGFDNDQMDDVFYTEATEEGEC